ncbi:hypothetical protein BaRGS_00009566 [Batillaria attramentaria]|uniref:MIB/HERC2 domain-containing protein n=1 Tax=Batillaria attramentaria TaxID=370345 RepID=A0ABD0LJE4_9CAEN
MGTWAEEIPFIPSDEEERLFHTELAPLDDAQVAHSIASVAEKELPVSLIYVSVSPPKPTGAELAKILKPGDRVKRGKDWKYDNEDGSPPGPGTVSTDQTGCPAGWVRVQWDAGSSNNYRMGAESCYDLELMFAQLDDGPVGCWRQENLQFVWRGPLRSGTGLPGVSSDSVNRAINGKNPSPKGRSVFLICPQQCFSSSHEECTGVKSISSIAKQERETLTEQARRLRDRESELTAQIRKLEREVLDAQTHFSSMRSQVKATFDGLHQMVEKRRQEINTKLQEEENSVVTPKQDKKASLEEQRVSVAAHAGSVERLVVPSPDSVLLGMLEKLRTRLDDLEKQTQLSPDSQDVRLASFTFDSDMVKRFEEAFGVFGVVTTKGGTASGTAVYGKKKCLVRGHDESMSPPKPTGAALAQILKPGDRVKRGKDLWIYGNEGGSPPGPGTVSADQTGCAAGWVRVQWDAGSCKNYRMGAKSLYDLELASRCSDYFEKHHSLCLYRGVFIVRDSSITRVKCDPHRYTAGMSFGPRFESTSHISPDSDWLGG